jgi:hypothetical protein
VVVDAERAGAPIYRSATATDFATIARTTGSSNKINPTESTNQLIWTALIIFVSIDHAS